MKPSTLLFATAAALSIAACSRTAPPQASVAPPPPPVVVEPQTAPVQPAASAEGSPQVADAGDSDADDATAEPGQPLATGKDARPRFRDADADHDGRLSEAEAVAMPAVARRFAMIDTDHDGYVTHRELRVARERMKAARAARGGATADPGAQKKADQSAG